MSPDGQEANNATIEEAPLSRSSGGAFSYVMKGDTAMVQNVVSPEQSNIRIKVITGMYKPVKTG